MDSDPRDSKSAMLCAEWEGVMVQTIVVVEDEPEVNDLVRDVLEMEGYRVIAVQHPHALEAQLADAEPDLFLLDIMLPGISGIELAERLRGEGYAGTPMVAMSASRLMSNLASGSGVFADAFDKPFEIDDLLSCVAKHVRQNADPGAPAL